MEASVATGWPPPIVWALPRGELDDAITAISKRSGRPYRRRMTAAELEEKREVVARMRGLGLM